MLYRINSRELHALPFGFLFKQINVLHMIILYAKTKIYVPIATFAERWNLNYSNFLRKLRRKSIAKFAVLPPEEKQQQN